MSVSEHINWFLLFSGFFSLWGVAVILASLNLRMFALKNRKNVHSRSAEIGHPRKWIGIGLGLIILGVVLSFFKLPTNRFLGNKLADSNDIQIHETFDQIHFEHGKLSIDQNNKKLINDECIPLMWRGHVALPFMRLPAGIYVFEFQARGTEGVLQKENRREYTQLEVECETENSKGYLELRNTVFLELSREYRDYKMTAVLEKDCIAKFQISFYNNLAKFRDGRLAWIRNISLRKIISE